MLFVSITFRTICRPDKNSYCDRPRKHKQCIKRKALLCHDTSSQLQKLSEKLRCIVPRSSKYTIFAKYNTEMIHNNLHRALLYSKCGEHGLNNRNEE